ncbi:MAG: hypothetical protein AAF149_25065 [Bacteroidota bacterium]
MRRNEFLLCLIILLLVCPSFGQSNLEATYFPPSPNASSLLEYASVPVNLYSGIPQIEVPIFNLENEVQDINVYLSYHASGNKVQDIASSVGLGWTLNAGGAITRLVRGGVDSTCNFSKE